MEKDTNLKKFIKTTIREFLNENYYTTPPTFERLKDMDGLREYSNDNYKIVRFAYDDEGNNGFALLDMKNKKIISWSLTGSSEFRKFKELGNF